MSILNKSQVKTLIPTGALMSAEGWDTLDQELNQVIKEVLIFSQRKANEEQYKTISPNHIKKGLVEYCESYSLNYLLMLKDQMTKTTQEYFDTKIKEVKENASKRLYNSEISSNQ